jgi:hypothetical protein
MALANGTVQFFFGKGLTLFFARLLYILACYEVSIGIIKRGKNFVCNQMAFKLKVKIQCPYCLLKYHFNYLKSKWIDYFGNGTFKGFHFWTECALINLFGSFITKKSNL